jgi:putative RNA 2'-phosphotransferase
MSDDRLTKISKFLSYVLRHKPEHIGLVLDAQGWANIEELMTCHSFKYGTLLLKQDILDVVASCEKSRYELSADQLRIRAVQGHSIIVDVGLTEDEPPARLYHGTAERFYPTIRVDGLKPMSRQHVHLSADFTTASTVGRRHGSPKVLIIDAERMYREGIKFWRSTNGVWLVHEVESKYIIKPIKENA